MTTTTKADVTADQIIAAAKAQGFDITADVFVEFCEPGKDYGSDIDGVDTLQDSVRNMIDYLYVERLCFEAEEIKVMSDHVRVRFTDGSRLFFTLRHGRQGSSTNPQHFTRGLRLGLEGEGARQ
tara:strand:+ start:85 stop:456 length:372 start_codon:yes stop_codon:yes gene_type:complete